MEDAENHSRRNNFKLKGIPADLRSSVVAIFNQLLGDPSSNMEIDRVTVMRGVSQTTPQDVPCCGYFFTIKDAIMRAAWQQGPLDFDGTQIHPFLDLCCRTLCRQGLLKPLLELIHDLGATYTWRYPLSLFTPTQLPRLSLLGLPSHRGPCREPGRSWALHSHVLKERIFRSSYTSGPEAPHRSRDLTWLIPFLHSGIPEITFFCLSHLSPGFTKNKASGLGTLFLIPRPVELVV